MESSENISQFVFWINQVTAKLMTISNIEGFPLVSKAHPNTKIIFENLNFKDENTQNLVRGTLDYGPS